MTAQGFTTLAYMKSPKASKRTTFQDELQAAVSARASKAKTDQHSYSDEFSGDEDDFLSNLLKSRNKRTSAFKAGKSKTKINDFDISDDEGKRVRTKRVSFLKTQRISSPSEETTASESRDSKLPDSSVSPHTDNDASSALHPEEETPFKSRVGESADAQITRGGSSETLPHQTSDDTTLDMPLSCEKDIMEPQGPAEKSNHFQEQCSQTPLSSAADLKHTSSADDVTGKEPPRPKPRQRTLGLSHQATEKIAEDAESQDLSRPQTSSASIPLSTDTSSNFATRNSSPNLTDGDDAVPCSLSQSPCKSEQLQLFTTSAADYASSDGFVSDDGKEQERKYSTSFEELNQSIGDGPDQVFDTRTSSHSKISKRSQAVSSRKVQSKYLGSLKVLDDKVSQHESQPQAANSLRAAIYQNWLQKKKEKSRENMLLRKKEEILKESKKKEKEEAKREEAAASFEAWKKKKAECLKAKAKEKQDMIRKEQRAMEEKEGKRQSAEQVFEQWKRQHDHLLQETYRKRRVDEKELRLRKQEKEAERKRESKSAFSNWCEEKKDVLHEKVTTEREAVRSKAEEEQYLKEERDRMALEEYEKWLARKDREQKIQREERRIQAVLCDSPPPPWSPPNKTIPFRKNIFFN